MYWDRSFGEIRPWDGKENIPEMDRISNYSNSNRLHPTTYQAGFYFCDISFHMYICGKCKFTLER